MPWGISVIPRVHDAERSLSRYLTQNRLCAYIALPSLILNSNPGDARVNEASSPSGVGAKRPTRTDRGIEICR